MLRHEGDPQEHHRLRIVVDGQLHRGLRVEVILEFITNSASASALEFIMKLVLMFMISCITNIALKLTTE